jgi:hypothetical protein
MIRRLLVLLSPALLAILVLLPAAAGAQTQLTGQTPGGAFYNIVVPDGWTPADGLVIWNHGFSLSPIAPDPDLGPLAPVQLAEGYAVAASSYSLVGWALFETAQDLRDLVDVFEAEFGVPDQVIVYGASLGGIVTAQAIEVAGLGKVVGAMPICGALAGSRLWDGALDLRLIYDAVCGDVPGAAIPGGAGGLPFPPDPSFNELALGLAVNACTGVSAPPAVRTAEQQARLDRILAVTDLPENFLLTDMGFATFGIFDLVHDPRKLGGAMPFDNVGVDYGDASIDATIERVQADQAARRRLWDNYTPGGKVGDVKIVSLHTDKDGLVLVENESWYDEAVPDGNFTYGIVVEDVPSHCGFTEAEVVAAWETLRGWVAGLPQPAPADLQAACESIVAGGLAPGPCRIDPGFVTPDLSGRVRPRQECVPDATTMCLRDERFQVEVTWTNFQAVSGPGRVSGLQTADTGSFWFFDPDNIELFVKSLDGRQFNGNYWVFYGSLTNVAFEMTVTDTVSGLVKTYSNASGTFASNGDIDAF